MRGIGDCYLATTALTGGATAQKLYPNPFFTYTYGAESTAIEAQGFVSGRQQTVGSALGSVTHNLTLETQYVRRPDRALVMGHTAKDFSGIQFPVRVDATVPLAAPFEIADVEITAANRNYILVYDDDIGPLVPTADATTAPASVEEVQINTASGMLVFHEDAAGHPISYTRPYAFAGKGYGGQGSAQSLGELVFRAKTYDFGDEEGLIEFPKLSLTNVVEQPITGDVPTYSLEFLAAVPAGWSHPYRFLELATAA